MAEAHAYDIQIGNKSYIVARQGVRHTQKPPYVGTPMWKSDWVPARAGDAASISDVPQDFTTWHAGAFYGESQVQGCYHYATGMDMRFPGVGLMAPAVTTIDTGGTSQVSDIFIEASEIFVLQGRYAFHIESDDTVETISGADGSTGKDFGATYVATKSIDFQAFTYVGFSSDHHIYKFDGTTWTQATDNEMHAQWFAKDWLDVGTAGHRLVRGYSTNSVNYCAAGDDPLTYANWLTDAAAWKIGDTSHALTYMLSGHENRVYVCKTNGLFGLDNQGRNDNLLGQVEFMEGARNGEGAIYDGAGVLYPHVSMGLLRYDEASGSVISVHPGDKTGNRSPIRGIITALAQMPPWTYATIYNGTDSYLLAGRWPSQGEQMPAGWVGPMIWHPLATLTGVRCDCMRPSGLSDPPRLYFGHGTKAAYIRVPKSGNVVAELDTGNLRFVASGSLYLSPADWGAPGVPKELMGFELENESVSVSNYVNVYVRLDGGGWQFFGRAQTAGRSTFYLPSGNWRGHRVEFRLDVVNTTNTTSVKIKPIQARASLNPVLRQYVTTTVYCMDNLPDRRGSYSTEKGIDLLTHLQDLQSQGPTTMYDWWTGSRVSSQIKVHRATPVIISQKDDEAVAYGCEVQLSVIRKLTDTPWVWGEAGGMVWGDGKVWS